MSFKELKDELETELKEVKQDGDGLEVFLAGLGLGVISFLNDVENFFGD